MIPGIIMPGYIWTTHFTPLKRRECHKDKEAARCADCQTIV
jgi:hypothetical protein